jgi:hypothetical protein
MYKTRVTKPETQLGILTHRPHSTPPPRTVLRNAEAYIAADTNPP